jgi:hypothetical protein
MYVNTMKVERSGDEIKLGVLSIGNDLMFLIHTFKSAKTIRRKAKTLIQKSLPDHSLFLASFIIAKGASFIEPEDKRAIVSDEQ